MRTDRNRVCAACRLRLTARDDRCPRCEAATVGPVAKPPDQPWSLRLTLSTSWAHLLPFALGGLIMGGILGDHPGLGMGIGLLFGVIVGLCHAVKSLFKIARIAGATLRLHVDTPPLASGSVVVGKAESAGTPLVALRSATDCLAFRLVGTFGGHDVDDAAVAPFVVVTADGARVHVAAPPASVDLSPGEPGAVPRLLWARVVEFMAARGVPCGLVPASLAEAALLVGDLVEVHGTISEEPDPSPSAEGSYRDMPKHRVIRETRDQPLLIRRASR